MLSVLTTKKEGSLNLRITRIFSAKSFSVATQTDLCSAGGATSSFSPAPLSGFQTIVADRASCQTVSTLPFFLTTRIPTSFRATTCLIKHSLQNPLQLGVAM